MVHHFQRGVLSAMLDRSVLWSCEVLAGGEDDDSFSATEFVGIICAKKPNSIPSTIRQTTPFEKTVAVQWGGAVPDCVWGKILGWCRPWDHVHHADLVGHSSSFRTLRRYRVLRVPNRVKIGSKVLKFQENKSFSDLIFDSFYPRGWGVGEW